MRDLLPTIEEWATPRLGLATVVRTSGSTPRPVGARMLVAPDGRIAGSVSGGCLEADVFEEAQSTLRGERPPRVLHYGISDEMGFEVGLSCGGTVDLLVEAVELDDPVVARWRAAVSAGEPVALVSLLDGAGAGGHVLVDGTAGTLVGSLGHGAADAAALDLGRTRIESGVAGVAEVAGAAAYVEPFVQPPHLVVIGASDIGAALCGMAQTCGYRVTVVDPRSAFLTRERFPTADALVPLWPDRGLAGIDLGPRDAAVCLSHDPKFDEPTLGALLPSPVGYIGAIGSRRTHAKRVARLRELGFDNATVARVHSPVGLDLGARTPAEIALSILAEAVAARRGRSGAPLRPPQAAAAAG